MPIENGITKTIPKIYKRDALSHLLFAHVNAMRMVAPSVTIEKAVESFRKYYNLTEEEYPTESAKRRYHNMVNELYQKQKDENSKGKD